MWHGAVSRKPHQEIPVFCLSSARCEAFKSSKYISVGCKFFVLVSSDNRRHPSRPLRLRSVLIVLDPRQGPADTPLNGYSTAMEACIRRVWLEHPPLSTKALEDLRNSLAEWEAWKKSRAEQVRVHQSQMTMSLVDQGGYVLCRIERLLTNRMITHRVEWNLA